MSSVHNATDVGKTYANQQQKIRHAKFTEKIYMEFPSQSSMQQQ